MASKKSKKGAATRTLELFRDSPEEAVVELYLLWTADRIDYESIGLSILGMYALDRLGHRGVATYGWSITELKKAFVEHGELLRSDIQNWDTDRPYLVPFEKAVKRAAEEDFKGGGKLFIEAYELHHAIHIIAEDKKKKYEASSEGGKESAGDSLTEIIRSFVENHNGDLEPGRHLALLLEELESVATKQGSLIQDVRGTKGDQEVDFLSSNGVERSIGERALLERFRRAINKQKQS